MYEILWFYNHLLTLHGSTAIHSTSTPVIFVYSRVVVIHLKFGAKLQSSLRIWPCDYLVPLNRQSKPPPFSSVTYHKYWALAHPRPRFSVIHFACIGVAPPQMFKPRRAQSTGSNSNAGKWIKLDLPKTQTSFPMCEHFNDLRWGAIIVIFLIQEESNMYVSRRKSLFVDTCSQLLSFLNE